MKENNKSPVWQIIDNLYSISLSERAAELERVLRHSSPEIAMKYYRDASTLHRSLFTKPMVTLYLLVFYGESNKSGFVDFCSNLILSGSKTYNQIKAKPDDFSDLPDYQEMNEDHIHVSEVVLSLLEEEQSEKQMEALAEKFLGTEFLKRKNIWEILTESGIEFALDLKFAEKNMPRIFKQFGENAG